MEISCLQAGVTMRGQPLMNGVRTEGLTAATFAVLLESQPGEAQPEEEAPEEATPEGADESSDRPVTCAPDGMIPPVPPDMRTSPDEMTAKIIGDPVDRDATPDGMKSYRPEVTPDASRPETRDFSLVGRTSVSYRDGPWNPGDIEVNFNPVAEDQEKMPDLRPPHPIRSAAKQARIGEMLGPISATSSSNDRELGDTSNDDPESLLADKTDDQAAFAVSVHDTSAPNKTIDPHTRVPSRLMVADPQHVFRQVGGKLADTQEGVIEVVLSPEELGTIRLVIAAGEKPAVTVFADRPETWDLLRRNADSLEKELQGAGIFGADISFADGSGNGNTRGDSPIGAAGGSWSHDEIALSANKAESARPEPTADRRIDIRI